MSGTRKKARKVYMHTLDGKPASFDGDQVAFAGSGPYVRKGITLHASLVTIKAEQRASQKWRAKVGYTTTPLEYGWCLVEVPA